MKKRNAFRASGVEALEAREVLSAAGSLGGSALLSELLGSGLGTGGAQVGGLGSRGAFRGMFGHMHRGELAQLLAGGSSSAATTPDAAPAAATGGVSSSDLAAIAQALGSNSGGTATPQVATTSSGTMPAWTGVGAGLTASTNVVPAGSAPGAFGPGGLGLGGSRFDGYGGGFRGFGGLSDFGGLGAVRSSLFGAGQNFGGASASAPVSTDTVNQIKQAIDTFAGSYTSGANPSQDTQALVTLETSLKTIEQQARAAQMTSQVVLSKASITNIQQAFDTYAGAYTGGKDPSGDQKALQALQTALRGSIGQSQVTLSPSSVNTASTATPTASSTTTSTASTTTPAS